MPPRKPKLPERQRKDLANAKSAERRAAKKEKQTEEERRAELDRNNELKRASRASAVPRRNRSETLDTQRYFK